jgi:hypothetical protein
MPTEKEVINLAKRLGAKKPKLVPRKHKKVKLKPKSQLANPRWTKEQREKYYRKRRNIVPPSVGPKIEWKPPTYSQHSATKYGPKCQHPRTRAAGTCLSKSIGEYDIPADYIPATRHADTPDIPRPKALLCRQHSRILDAWIKGIERRGSSHEAWCDICNHPNGKEIMERWCAWEIGATEVMIELGVSHRTLFSHIGYYNLRKQKASKDNLRDALTSIAEKSIASGQGFDAKTAVKALETLNKMRGEPRQVDVNVKGSLAVGVMDLTKLSNEELAAHFENLSRKLREAPMPKQLTPGIGDGLTMPAMGLAADVVEAEVLDD